MAIQIQQNLAATPNPTTLPRRIDFHQTLLSDQDAEPITVVYSLDPAHDVWFVDSSGKLTKRMTRAKSVGQTATVIHDRILLQRGPGQGPMALVEVDQTITDSAGVAIPDVCTVQLA